MFSLFSPSLVISGDLSEAVHIITRTALLWEFGLMSGWPHSGKFKMNEEGNNLLSEKVSKFLLT